MTSGYDEVRRRCAEQSPEVIRKLIGLFGGDDDHVLFIAIDAVLRRIDLSALSQEERQALLRLLP